jgi:hypothetical protein
MANSKKCHDPRHLAILSVFWEILEEFIQTCLFPTFGKEKSEIQQSTTHDEEPGTRGHWRAGDTPTATPTHCGHASMRVAWQTKFRGTMRSDFLAFPFLNSISTSRSNGQLEWRMCVRSSVVWVVVVAGSAHLGIVPFPLRAESAV